MNDDQLIELLQTVDEFKPDNGFSQSVLAQLPKRQAVRWRLPLFTTAYLLASALVLALFPFEHLSNLTSLLLSAPWLLAVIAAVPCGLGWMLAQELVGG